MNSAISWREHQHVKVFFNKAKRLEALFFVVFTCVFCNERTTPVKIFSECKWQSSFCFIAQAFGWVIRDSLSFIVPTLNYCIHYFLYSYLYQQVY